MTFSPIDSPDWQRAVVNAGKLLASLASNESSAVVDLPPNANTLAVFVPQVKSGQTVTVNGNTTAMYYPGVARPLLSDRNTDTVFFFTVLPELENVVTIDISPLANAEWYVYSVTSTDLVDIPELSAMSTALTGTDTTRALMMAVWDGTAPHLIAASLDGRIIPNVPTAGKKVTVASGTTEILTAPPSSGAWYLFGLDISEAGTSTAPCELIDSNGNSIAYDDPPTGGESHSISLDGFRSTGSVSIVTTVDATVVLRYCYSYS